MLSWAALKIQKNSNNFRQFQKISDNFRKCQTKKTKNVGALCSWYSITFGDDSLNVKESISVVHGLHPFKLYVCSVRAPNLSISTANELPFELEVVQEVSEFSKHEQLM